MWNGSNQDTISFTDLVGDLRGQLIENDFVIPIRLADKNLQTLPDRNRETTENLKQMFCLQASADR